MKMLDILKIGDKAILGRPAWYELGQNYIAHYVPDFFRYEEETPKPICNANAVRMVTRPILSGELIDPEDGETEGFIPMCKKCLRKLKMRT